MRAQDTLAKAIRLLYLRLAARRRFYEGRCNQCGGAAGLGKTNCRACNKLNKNRPEETAHHRARSAAERLRRKQAGLCQTCGNAQSVAGYTSCHGCAWRKMLRHQNATVECRYTCHSCGHYGHMSRSCWLFSWAREQGLLK